GVIGLLSKGESVTPVGRDADSNWLAIQFPPGSAGRGGVPLNQLDSVSAIEQFAVVLPTPLARTISPFPTSPPSSLSAAPARTPANAASATAATTTTITATPAINLGPTDIQITNISLLPDGRVAVTIGNRG